MFRVTVHYLHMEEVDTFEMNGAELDCQDFARVASSFVVDYIAIKAI